MPVVWAAVGLVLRRRQRAQGAAQGVPTFDNSNLRQLVLQLEHMAEDLNVQLQQLATMRQELETQLS